jgi:hypothetical protein
MIPKVHGLDVPVETRTQIGVHSVPCVSFVGSERVGVRLLHGTATVHEALKMCDSVSY